MHVQPYLFFNGRCEEAIEFYRTALGAKDIKIMRFKEAPPSAQQGMFPPGAENKVMHANFRVGDTTILASDGECKGDLRFEGFSLTILADNGAEAERVFSAIGNGGQVVMPLTKTFFSPAFGMAKDRFGVHWMVIVEQH
jgi:PhnB protein